MAEMSSAKRKWSTVRAVLAQLSFDVWYLMVGILLLFPFLISLLSGQSVEQGAPKFFQGLLIQTFIFAVYAMSYDLLMGFTGILSFGHALFFGSGAYFVAIGLKHLKWPFPAAVGLVVVVAVLLSLLIGVLSLRVRGVYFAMVTLAFAQVAFLLATATDFKQWTGAEDGLQGIPVPAIISPTDNRLRFYYIALAFAGLMYVLARRIVNSPTGRVFVAIRENENRATMIGYNILLYKVIALVISGVLAALAGLLNALWNLNATPTVLSIDTTIDALLMTIIGGVGTLVGPMLGAGVLTLLGYWLNATFGRSWLLILGIIYVALVLFLPYGLVGTWRTRRVGWGGWRELLSRYRISSSREG